MKTLITILLIALCAIIGSSPGLAQFRQATVMSANTIIPATAEYGPDGAANLDSAWLWRGSNDPNASITLFIKADSVTGYTTTDDSLTVSVQYRVASDTLSFFAANLTGHVVFDQAMGTTIPADTGYYVTFTPPPHRARRYLASVDDTMSVTIYEIEQTAAPWKK